VVDLDGTLTRADISIEALITACKRSPTNLLRLPFWLLRGRAAFKEEIARRGGISPTHLPYREGLLDYLHLEKAKGRRIILATAAHQSIADGVSKHLGLFDRVLGSSESRHLRGDERLNAIREVAGDLFVYVGDGRADPAIWNAARAAILVDVDPRIGRRLRHAMSIEREFVSGRGDRILPWLRALRVHQWLKNLLLYVPLLTAFYYLRVDKVMTATLAFASFSLTASATYIINDLWDLATEATRASAYARLRAERCRYGRVWPSPQSCWSRALPWLHGSPLASSGWWLSIWP